MHDPATILSEEQEIIELPGEEFHERRARWSPANFVLGSALALVGAAGAYVMWFHGISQTAGAASTDPLPSTIGLVGDAGRVDDFLSQGQLQIPAMRVALSQASGAVHDLLEYPAARQVPLTALSRNPFLQPDGSASPQPAASGAVQDHPAAERAAMLKAEEGLQLQSITRTESRRSCMINDVLYDEGDTIAGFTIEQINADSVVIRNGLYRFELTMNQ